MGGGKDIIPEQMFSLICFGIVQSADTKTKINGHIDTTSIALTVERKWMEGETMLTSDGYCLTYYLNKNQIVIRLPQTYETLTNTYDQVVDRRTDVAEIELAVLLDITKLIFHKGERREDETD